METNKDLVSKGIKLAKYLISFLFIYTLSGLAFYLVETLYRGYSYGIMFVCTGICGLGLALINDGGYRFETDYRIQVSTGAALCTFLNLIVGKLFNSNYEIWDYRGMIGTLRIFDSQVNLFFVGLWIIIAAIAIPILDFVQWQLGVGEKPYYRIGKKYFYPWGEKEK